MRDLRYKKWEQLNNRAARAEASVSRTQSDTAKGRAQGSGDRGQCSIVGLHRGYTSLR
jgi:hypothetical protein